MLLPPKISEQFGAEIAWFIHRGAPIGLKKLSRLSSPRPSRRAPAHQASAAVIPAEILKLQVSARSQNYPMTNGNLCNLESI